MKRITNRIPILAICLAVGIALFSVSCQKDLSCETCATAANVAPKAVAGADQVIQLPVDSILLDARASSDPDGRIAAYRWREISGPALSQIVRPTDSITRVRSLLAGQYQFELTVTDNGGLTARDTIKVTVRAQGQQNQPPVACAGPDQTIILPVNSVTVDGRCSTDPDNNIVSYLWTRLSGPATFQITSPDQPRTSLTDLAEGSFVFQLMVRDSTGLTSMDTVRVTVNPLPVETDNVDIYVAGNELSGPKYWKNGQGVELKIASYYNGNATDITVAGDDVYVCGWEGDYLNQRYNQAKYWKNGQEVFLTGTTGAGANAIAVSGNDVYVAGWELKSQPGISVAKYWRNGVAVALTDGTKEADATDIALVGGDVYVSGYDGDVARVWRNGQLLWSSSAAVPSYAIGIAVNGTDVYLTGILEGKAVYWKNGQVFPLSNTLSQGVAICPSGPDVYVAGAKGDYGSSVAGYWKNGQEIMLSGSAGAMYASDLFVLDNNVYVTGFYYTQSTRGGYWKNGQFFPVGADDSQLSSIYIKRR